MASEAYRKWYVEGLQALKSASEQGRAEASHYARQMTSQELRSIAEHGAAMAGRHAETIEGFLAEAGGTSGNMPNVIMEGISKGNRQIVESAQDPTVRDASIIAGAQIALHYYVAAYGTLASTAKHLGMTEQAQAFKQMSDEFKEQDRRYTEIAETMANDKAA